MIEEVRIEKIVHGGQGLGTLPDGRKVFVWNALPGELVRVQVWRGKKKYAEGIALEVLEPSAERVEPREVNHMGTSPWQIMNFETENKLKSEITRDIFAREQVTLPEFAVRTDGVEYGYRNKMEYSFYGDDDGLHLALFARGSHRKEILTGSALAAPVINEAANAILKVIPKEIRGSDLKTIIVRSSQKGETVAALYVKAEKFPELPLPSGVKGLRVYHSNPKSPASVPTRLLYELGDVHLSDELFGTELTYDVESFFQVNVPVFELALTEMKNHLDEDSLTDMYAGVGTIGLSLAKKAVDLIELDTATAAMARLNAEKSHVKAQVIEASTEKVLEHIRSDRALVFDPPRAGLHDKVVDKVLETLPPKILYLSCNPATHARDIAKLQEAYTLESFEVYNFFPRTPHIESLAVLRRK
ncbi:MAG: hypothetical protein JWL85_244 [Candidatus Saccharibacteria bacterium]|nr:hypothetical protein [Candidatus Saccharibacteria bacterium]